MVLSNKVVFGTVNANRRHFESGVRHLQEIEVRWRELGDEQAVKEHFMEKESQTLGQVYEPTMLRQEVEMNVQGVLLYLKKHRTSS
jgi:hypothetical protein